MKQQITDKAWESLKKIPYNEYGITIFEQICNEIDEMNNYHFKKINTNEQGEMFVEFKTDGHDPETYEFYEGMKIYMSDTLCYTDEAAKFIELLKEYNLKESDNMILNGENIIKDVLNSNTIPIWEKRGFIGEDKSFEENEAHLNDLLLEELFTHRDWYDKVLKEITKRYMGNSPKQIIKRIIQLCEADLDKTEEAAEWIISKSKDIDRYLYLNTVEKDHTDTMTINDILLHVQTDKGDDSLLSIKAWGYYESTQQGDNFSKEELTELLNKLENNN